MSDKGPYLFLLTSGYNDRDYHVDGLYSCDYEVTQEQWNEFRAEEGALRARKRAELCTLETPRNIVMHDEAMLEQRRQFREWDAARGTVAQLFIAEHQMKKLEYVELDNDGAF